MFDENILRYHLNLLGLEGPDDENEDVSLAPILSISVLKYDGEYTGRVSVPGISQIGLLAGFSHMLGS